MEQVWGDLQSASCMIFSVIPNSASHKIGNLLKTVHGMRYLVKVFFFFFLLGHWIGCFFSGNFVDDKVLSLCQKFGHCCTWRKGFQLGGLGHEHHVHDLGANDASPPWLVEIQALFKHRGDG